MAVIIYIHHLYILTILVKLITKMFHLSDLINMCIQYKLLRYSYEYIFAVSSENKNKFLYICFNVYSMFER